MKYRVEIYKLLKSNPLCECMEKAESSKRKCLHKSPIMFMRAHETEPLDGMEPLWLVHLGSNPWGEW
jgi:hypothetical protein